ncbi:hypothetical protein GCM10007898_13410 [Dyella flagellata]|uniref:DUF2894 domain-containing protein n=2 Tax=Dyella flagellata TaxID=1867833 RepID=A0ABQ5X9N0_9GAMM|nr:hypothetical protein GCM10007898_13410 [Dyella flagellata]
MDPVRFQFIAAMARRTAGHGGKARAMLDEKLARLLDAYASDLDKAAFNADATDPAPVPSAPERGALGALTKHIDSHVAARSNELGANDALLRRDSFPSLGLLDDFRKTWSRLRAESQLQQSLEQVPTDAGPLNSSALVHRSIALMRESSPEYLRHFLAYVDDLSWLTQIGASGILADAAKDTPPGRSARKRAGDK